MIITVSHIRLCLLCVCCYLMPAQAQAEQTPNWQQLNSDQTDDEKKARQQAGLIQRLSREKQGVGQAVIATRELIASSRNRVYLPELYLRLADLYLQQARLTYSLRRIQSGGTGGSDSLEGNNLKMQAIETYLRIINHHPDFSAMDKVHFYLAHEYRELQRYDDMVASYRHIIKSTPKSSYVPEAHLLLGDYYFDNEDLNKAAEEYAYVLPFTQSPAMPLARHKLAWVWINRKDYKVAIELLEFSLESFSDVAELEKNNAQLNKAGSSHMDSRLQSLLDIAYLYPLHYKKSTPVQTLTYFQRYSWSRPVYIAALDKLAYRYFIKRDWANAAFLYRELTQLQHGSDKLLDYSRNIYISNRELKDIAGSTQDVYLFVKASKTVKYAVHKSDEEKQPILDEFEIYSRDTATRLHELAKSSQRVEDFSHSAEAYKVYLDFFEQSTHKTAMLSNYAESLFGAKRFAEAGMAYEEAVNNNSEKPQPKMRYSAIASYYSALQDKSLLTPLQLAQSRAGLTELGLAYMQDFPKAPEYSDIQFNIAWVQYDQGHYKEAIGSFSDYLQRYPKGKKAAVAVDLSLDAYHVMQDYEGLTTYGKQIASNPNLSTKIKQNTAAMVATAQSKVISAMIVASINDWEKGRDTLREYAKTHAATGKGEQALYALFASSMEQGDLPTMLLAGNDLVQQYPQRKDNAIVYKKLVEAALNAGQYRLLAEQLQGYAMQFPQQKDATAFLLQAADLNTALQQYDVAEQAYSQILRQSSTVPQKNAAIAGMMVVIENSQAGNTAYKIKHFEALLASAKGEQQRLVHAKLALLYTDQGNTGQADLYRKMALTNSSRSGKPSAALADLLAQLQYQQVLPLQPAFAAIQFTTEIDPAIVAQKIQQLEQLQAGYMQVLNSGSLSWSLQACLRLEEINQGYARFLIEAPRPALSETEAVEYAQLIEQQAQPYLDEAQQFAQTAAQLAEKQDMFAASKQSKQAFGSSRQSQRIAMAAVDDETLGPLHKRLAVTPGDIKPKTALIAAYINKRDYLQAAVIAESSLQDKARLNIDSQVELNLLLGLARLYAGQDGLAYAAYQQAGSIDASNVIATLHQAALLDYYGDQAQADDRYQMLNRLQDADDMDAQQELLSHPLAVEKWQDR